MAYTHSKYEVEMVPITPSTAPAAGQNGFDAAVTGVQAMWSPGFVPHLIRGAALMTQVTTALTGLPVLWQFRADISTPGTPTNMFSISFPSAISAHKSIYYVPTYNIEIKPGTQVELFASTGATAGTVGKAVLYVEPRWEEPANVTSMQLTT